MEHGGTFYGTLNHLILLSTFSKNLSRPERESKLNENYKCNENEFYIIQNQFSSSIGQYRMGHVSTHFNLFLKKHFKLLWNTIDASKSMLLQLGHIIWVIWIWVILYDQNLNDRDYFEELAVYWYRVCKISRHIHREPATMLCSQGIVLMLFFSAIQLHLELHLCINSLIPNWGRSRYTHDMLQQWVAEKIL